MQPGTRVRLKGDPSSIGVITAKPPLERAGRTFIEIELPAGRRTVPLIELEEVPETADALTDFTTGKLSGPDDLRRALTHTLKGLEASDTKFARLVEWLGRVREADGDQRIIVFSSFRRTISYLARRLQAAGFGVMELHGGIKDDRQATIARFADSPGGTILLTSEVGGEGLDLQFCRILFNWDLPWNPMKVEQRIGRIDRIGQRSPSIEIINLIAADTIEEQVYNRLYERLGIIREALGDFEPILGDIIRDIELVLTDPELSPDRRAAELDRATQAAEQRKRESDELEREAPGLVAHGDSILQKIKDAQAPYKRLTGDDLRDYVSAGGGQVSEAGSTWRVCGRVGPRGHRFVDCSACPKFNLTSSDLRQIGMYWTPKKFVVTD